MYLAVIIPALVKAGCPQGGAVRCILSFSKSPSGDLGVVFALWLCLFLLQIIKARIYIKHKAQLIKPLLILA